MEYKKFKEILKNNKLTVKKFSELANISYNTCNAWSKRGLVSDWVESWLNLYINNKNLQDDKGVTIDEKEYQELLQLKESLQTVMGGLNK
ncbi:hypothetical protein KKC13_00830 [bacterium]|nr:hypothetical protein [bacterium]MBU1958939.1 hypothetical protein [bacterium]